MMDESMICPGIKGMVEFLRTNGFKTSDSGDGSRFKDGMEGAMEEPMVAMFLDGDCHLWAEANRLYELLDGRGIKAAIEATYYPVDDKYLLLIYGEELRDFEKRQR
jgi:hypothetical protein